MTKLFKELTSIAQLIELHQIGSISFDIDGTLYPMAKVQLYWWLSLLTRPLEARRFYNIKKSWEGRRLGNAAVPVNNDDLKFFENFLITLLNPRLVSPELKDFIASLSDKKIFFLSDHGAEAKLVKLDLFKAGTAINCLVETGELKPHFKISELLKSKYGIDPDKHLHIGDRWSDEAQAKDLGCSFYKLICPLY